MTVAFVGSDDFERTPVSAIQLLDVLRKLVVDDGADVFFFTNEGTFDFTCWQIVSQLKTDHPNIKRIYAQTGYENNRDGLQDLELCYDKIVEFNAICEDKTLAPYVRNRIMVGLCDVLVTYFNTSNLRTPRIESVTESTIKFAKRYKKRIINMYADKYNTIHFL